MLKDILVAASVGALAGWLSVEPPPAPPDIVFVGRLASLNGEPTPTSKVEIRVYTPAGAREPRVYELQVACEDFGGKFAGSRSWQSFNGSWHTIMGQPEGDPMLREILDCDPIDATRYNAIVRFMGAGGELTEERGGYRLAAQGSTARFSGPIQID